MVYCTRRRLIQETLYTAQEYNFSCIEYNFLIYKFIQGLVMSNKAETCSNEEIDKTDFECDCCNTYRAFL